jgi:2,4-dienoyl-CoA reductase [(3E)-enoyl-CoA-producing], peroxisomal
LLLLVQPEISLPLLTYFPEASRLEL